jgi:hypothetical protein
MIMGNVTLGAVADEHRFITVYWCGEEYQIEITQEDIEDLLRGVKLQADGKTD